MIKFLKRLRDDEKGATLVEYSILLGLSGAVVIGAMGAIGTDISTILTDMKGAMAAIVP